MYTYTITYHVPGLESIVVVSAPIDVDALNSALVVAKSLPSGSVRSIVRNEE